MVKNNQKIPDGWSVKKLGEVTTLLTNGFVGSATPHYTEDETGVTYIQGFNVNINSFDLTGIKKVTLEFHKKNKKSCLQEGDLLTIQTGDIGVTARVPKYLAGSNCHALIISRFDTSICNSEFYLQYYNSSICQSRFKKIETGSTMKHLNVGDLESEYIPIPPLSEQEKIAGMLGTWDEAIEKLSDLIEQKKLLKKGLMQRLLTGKTRLSTFTQPWKDIELSDLLNYEQPSKYLVGEILPYDKNKIPVLTANKAFILGSTDDSSGIYTQGDCIIFDDFTTDIKYVNFPFKVKSSAIKILTPKTNTNLKFVYEQMKCIKYPLAGHKRYYLSEYQYITISIPDISEQQAIADVLSTADDEINLLNQKLEALKEQKKGLMQQLLTGQIRVKVN